MTEKYEELRNEIPGIKAEERERPTADIDRLRAKAQNITAPFFEEDCAPSLIFTAGELKTLNELLGFYEGVPDGEITEEDKHILLDIMGAALAQWDGNQEQLAANFGAYEDFDAKWELGKYFAELDKLLGRANAIMDRVEPNTDTDGEEDIEAFYRITPKTEKKIDALSKLPAEKLTEQEAEYVRRVQKEALTLYVTSGDPDGKDQAAALAEQCTDIIKELDRLKQ